MSFDSPPYTQSSLPPQYSPEPLADEERLEYTRRSSRRAPTGKFRTTLSGITLVLNGQDDDATIPRYCQNDLVHGTITVENTDKITNVVVKLEARQQLSHFGDSTETILLASDKHILWKTPSPDPCPSAHSFAFLFPLEYTKRGRIRPLPPSYEVSLSGSFTAKCIYTLSVTVSKNLTRIPLFGTSRTLNILVDYRPRSCPSRPIPLYDSFLTDFKSGPEEWRQILCEMQTRSKSGLNPIACSLFIPAAQTYGISDTIPFHVQLSGPLPSLRALLPHPSKLPRPTSSLSSTSSQTTTTVPETMSLRILLLREINMEVFGFRETRFQMLGEATFRPLPPISYTLGYAEEALDWEGEVRCAEDIHSGGFFTERLVVRDLIALTLTPPHPSSPLLPLRHVHPIKFVTHSWGDVQNSHPQDR